MFVGTMLKKMLSFSVSILVLLLQLFLKYQKEQFFKNEDAPAAPWSKRGDSRCQSASGFLINNAVFLPFMEHWTR